MKKQWIYWLVVFLLCGCYLVRGVRAAQQNNNSSSFDQRSYLGLALNIREGRDMSDGKRNPLVPAILSPFAERDWPFYVKAKYLNLLIGCCAIALSYELGRRWFHPWVGLTVAALLSLNQPFLHVSSHVMAEPTLLCLTLVTWYLMTRALRAPHRTAWHWAAGAGLACGLAYLTKATALQMVPAFVACAFFVHGWQFWRRREIWVFLAVWALAWSPLIVFNVGEYGNPLYNYNYKHEIFLDSPTERHFADISEAPTLQTYLQEHTVADMAYRMWFGLKEVTRILFRALAPVHPDRVQGAGELAWIAAWLALAGTLVVGRKWYAASLHGILPAYILLGLMWFASMIPLGWFVQASNVGPRFIVTFHPLFYIIALGTFDLWLCGRRAGKPVVRGTGGPWGVWLAAVLVLSLVSTGTALADWPEIRHDHVALEREANARPQAVLAWLEEGTPYGTRVLWGPSYTLPNWIYERRLSLKDVPSKVVDWQGVVDDSTERELRYALLDWEMVYRREAAFDEHFAVDYPHVRIVDWPEGWALLLPYDGFPSNWSVWRMLDAVPLDNPRDVALGDDITFFGYETYPPRPMPGETLYVTLYWRAEASLERDYSVFVHLRDKTGWVIAQADSWPLAGRHPTSHWQEGQLIGDRYALTIPQGTALGDYDLVAGMYLLETMERLPVVLEDGATATDGQIDVTTVSVVDTITEDERKR